MYKCIGCGSRDIVMVLELGDHAWCNDFITKDQLGKENKYPLNLVICGQCQLVQIDYIIPKEIMFSNHPYVSGTTKGVSAHFKKIAKTNIDMFDIKNGDIIVDIGGNDGTGLKAYKEYGIHNCLNVESASNIAEIARQAGVETHCAFYTEEVIRRELPQTIGKVKLVNASGVFYHLEDIHSVIRGIKLQLREDGVFVAHCLYLGDMLSKNAFDAIYHEHLSYYSATSITNLLAQYGLEVFDIEFAEFYGGGFVVRAGHVGRHLKTERLNKIYEQEGQVDMVTQLSEFAERCKNVAKQLRDICLSIQSDGDRIVCVGSPARGNTLLTYAGLDSSIIHHAVEKNPMKWGKYTPVTHIPIEEEVVGPLELNVYYLLLSWSFADEIIPKYPRGSRFIMPFPEPHIIYYENGGGHDKMEQ